MRFSSLLGVLVAVSGWSVDADNARCARMHFIHHYTSTQRDCIFVVDADNARCARMHFIHHITHRLKEIVFVFF